MASLIDWIKQVFTRTPVAVSSTTTSATSHEDQVLKDLVLANTPEHLLQIEDLTTINTDVDWQADYLQWLLEDLMLKAGLATPTAASNLSALQLLQQLQLISHSKFAGQDLIPRVPAILPQLFKHLRDENASGKSLADIIAKDVVLVAEVLNEVNSPYYGTSNKIQNLESALLLLGQNGLRMLLAKVSFRPIIQVQSGSLTKLLAPVIWEQSEACANAGRLFAVEQGEDPFPAFLAGLLQNVGLIVALRIADLSGRRQCFPQDARFRARLLRDARHLSGRIGEHWGFPANVVTAIDEQQHFPNHLQANPLSQILYQAGQISQISLLQKAGILSDDDEILMASLTVSSKRCLRALKIKSAANNASAE